MNKTVYRPGVFWNVGGWAYQIAKEEDGYSADLIALELQDGATELETHNTITVGTVQGAHQAAERMIAVL